jgi:hypothetical protein
MSSPTSTTFRISETHAETVFRILQFDLLTFVEAARRCGGSTVSPTFAYLSKEEIATVQNYSTENGAKLKLKSVGSGGQCFVYPLRPHESVATAVEGDIIDWNRNRTGKRLSPLNPLRSADVDSDEGVVQPDCQFMAGRRTHNSPNFVLETNYHAVAPVRAFLDRLNAYFTNTRDVMVVMGVNIYNERVDGTFAAVAILLARTDAHHGELLQLTSFGSAPIQAQARMAWELGTGALMTGVGVVGYPPCDAAHAGHGAYFIELPQPLMLARNVVPPLVFHDGHLPGPDPLQISLFEVQSTIAEAFRLG